MFDIAYDLAHLYRFSQLLSLMNLSHDNPLLAIIPSTGQEPTTPIPFRTAFTLLSLLLHVNLISLAFSDQLKTGLRLHVAGIRGWPLSYKLSYALGTAAPAISVYSRRTWQSSVWWSLTLVVIFTVQNMTTSIAQGSESIFELEAMKYLARGA